MCIRNADVEVCTVQQESQLGYLGRWGPVLTKRMCMMVFLCWLVSVLVQVSLAKGECIASAMLWTPPLAAAAALLVGGTYN